MKIYQKKIEKYLNKEFNGDIYDLIYTFTSKTPGVLNVFKLGEDNDKEIYYMFNEKNEEYDDVSEEDWDSLYSISLEFWVTKLDNNKLFVE